MTALPDTWRWWYASIADWMLRNPGKMLEQCASDFQKHPNTISRIVNSDVFKAYLAQRRKEWQSDHDAKLTQKLGQVAMKTMEVIEEKLEKKRDSIGIDVLSDLMGTSLESLGFGKPAAPAVQLNQFNDNSQHVTLPGAVTPAALEEARQALRLAQSKSVTLDMVLPAPSERDAGSVGAAVPSVVGAPAIETGEE